MEQVGGLRPGALVGHLAVVEVGPALGDRAAGARLAVGKPGVGHQVHHCRQALRGAADGDAARFGQRRGQGDLVALDEPTLAAALAEAGCITVRSSPEDLPPIVDLMAGTGISPTKSAARRAIAEGGAYLNNRKVSDEGARPQAADLLYGRFLVLRRGRRTVAGVEVVTS